MSLPSSSLQLRAAAGGPARYRHGEWPARTEAGGLHHRLQIVLSARPPSSPPLPASTAVVRGVLAALVLENGGCRRRRF